jgi:hypothetical protein
MLSGGRAAPTDGAYRRGYPGIVNSIGIVDRKADGSLGWP